MPSDNDELRDRYLRWRARKAEGGGEGSDEDDEEFGHLSDEDDDLW